MFKTASRGLALVLVVLLLSGVHAGQSAEAQSSVPAPVPESSLRQAQPARDQSGLKAPIAEPGPVEGHVPGLSLGNASDAEMWRRIRRGMAGTVSFPQAEGGVLIQSEGEEWRAIRNGPVSRYGSWIVLGMIGLLAFYFVLRGRMRITGGRSGRTVLRFTLTQRLAHWFAAVLWVLLALTGLVLLFGKHVLLPTLGPGAFGIIASAAMQAHNLFGPLFIAALVALFVAFVRGNGFGARDLAWFARAGGFFGGHASSGRYNAGEKAWFWAVVLFGLALSASGILLEFPFLADLRQYLQLANLVHAVTAILFIGFGLAHIYLGTLGVEGALEAMTRGEADENWVREHHDLWLDELAKTGTEATPAGGREAEARA